MIRYLSRLSLFGLAVIIGPLGAQQNLPAEQAVAQTAEKTDAVEVAVLCYKSFSASEGEGGISATTFAAQMNYLKARGIKPVSLQEFIAWRRGELVLTGPSVLITLDEADAAAYTVAHPVLSELGFPYVIFVDGRSFQNSTTALDIAKLKEMQQAGASIGSCSMTRPQAYDWQFAAQSGPDAALKMAERELGLSAQRITATFGECVAFSYPRGYANAHMVENLAVYGYKAAFGLSEGKVQPDSPSFMLERYIVSDMPGFAHAVNFGPAEEDATVLQQIREEAAKHLPVSQPVTVEIPAAAGAAMPTLGAERVAVAAVQPALPVLDDLENVPQKKSQEAAPIPAPVVVEAPAEQIADPVLPPRPVCTRPAAGPLEKLNPDADWTTREFTQPVVARDKTRVAVLGYHNFSNTRPVSDMLMRTSEFCQQMQYIKDAGLAVITMQDFLDWLLGDRCLPERCVLITIDDGWRSVYTDAYPVLKEYGYPFTLYLYTTYLSGRGQSMTPDMIREMMESGATIGSHSTTHLYPSQWKRYAQDSPEYAAQLKQEFPDSIDKIKSLFGNCSTFCYPGGYYTQPMLESLQTSGISAAFTVIEKKVTIQETPLQVHRYMVLGTDPRVFRRAVNFDDVPGIKPTAQGITEARERAQAFFPEAFGAVLPPVNPAPEAPVTSPPGASAPSAELEDIPEPTYVAPAV